MTAFAVKLESLFQKVAPSYDFHFMLKILEDEFSHLNKNELIARISEFLKFAYLRSLYETEENFFVPVKKPIDEIWHAFIVQTRDYPKFCQALPGNFFLHHTTTHLDDFGGEKNKSALVQDMLAWIPRYREHFGPFTEEAAEYWLMPSFLKEKFDLSLEQINALT
jgi:hypothetical protein